MPAQLKERLRELLDQSTGILSFVGFGSLTCISLALPEYFSLKTLPDLINKFQNLQYLSDFMYPKIAPLSLIITTIFWYYRYKAAVINELILIDEIFEEEHAPRRLASLDYHKIIPLIGYVLVLTYCALILLAPYISLYCVGALVLHVADLTGSTVTLQNLNKFFARFPVQTHGESIDFIRERREVVKMYYFDHPTLPRIGILLVVTAVILVSSLKFFNQGFWQYVPYVLMIFNILIGEMVMSLWRGKRDRDLDQIDEREEQFRSVGSKITEPQL